MVGKDILPILQIPHALCGLGGEVDGVAREEEVVLGGDGQGVAREDGRVDGEGAGHFAGDAVFDHRVSDRYDIYI